MMYHDAPEELEFEGNTYKRPDNYRNGLSAPAADQVANYYREKGAPVRVVPVADLYYVYVCTCWLN